MNYLRDNGDIPKDSKIVVHNFADQKYPGGYFTKKMCHAQEESLCAVSGLYPILQSAHGKYKMLYDNVLHVHTDVLNEMFSPVLYVPNVPTVTTYGSLDNSTLCDYVTASLMRLVGDNVEGEKYDEQLTERIGTVLKIC